MDTETVVVVVSSDEEEVVKTRSMSVPSSGWVSAEAPGAHDVSVVDELPSAAVMAKGNCGDLEKTKGPLVDDCEEDDDDCVVLEGDPDKAAVFDEDNGVEQDDLKIVGEKGQIACRDYPHPRHLCVKFPFSHTPHYWHCHQCHCYVCDSLAPCARWGNGSSPMDHCWATDKEEMWKQQRQFRKKSHPLLCSGASVSAPGMVAPISSVSAAVSMPSPMQSLSNSIPISMPSLMQSLSNPIPISMPSPMQPSSNSTHLYLEGHIPMLGSNRSSTSIACSSTISREMNLTDPVTIQRLNALIQAKQRSTQVNMANKRHPLAPSSCFVQKIRKGGHSAPHARTAYSNHGRTSSSRGSIMSAYQELSPQGPGLALPHANPPNVSANVSPLSSAVLTSAIQHPFVPPIPVNTRCPPISAIGMNHGTITTPRLQQRQHVAQHMGNFQRSGTSGTDAARLNEILAGLEAELGLPSRNHTTEFNCSNSSFLPHTMSSSLCDPSSQVFQPGMNANVGQAFMNTGMDIFTSGSGWINMGVSQDFVGPAPAMAPQLQQEQLSASPLDPPVNGFNLDYNSSFDQ